jgi:tetratricopeptide (TPR) repeat protein
MIIRIIVLGFTALILVQCKQIPYLRPDYMESYSKAEDFYEDKDYKKSLLYYDRAIAQQIASSPEIVNSHLKVAYIQGLFRNFRDAHRTLDDLTYVTRKIENEEQRKKVMSQIKETRRKIRRLASRAKRRRNTAYVQKIYSQGVARYRKGDVVSAYKLFKKIQDENYKNTEKYYEELEDKVFQEGFQFYAADQYKEAVEKFILVLEIDPRHKEAKYYKDKAERKLQVLESM